MLIKKGTSNIFKVMKGNTAIKVMRYVEPTPTEEYFLTFSSPDSFTVSATNYWDGTVELSTDKETWNTWSGSAVASVNNGDSYKVYLRGTGNTYFSTDTVIIGPSGVFSFTGNNISCIGNIETLLDYQTVINGGHPPMANYCFYGLFYGCTGLISSPDLLSTTLSESCYRQMFMRCSDLLTSPKLPATTLANYCYANMFKNCTSLEALPVLPALELPRQCYREMFRGCTSIQVSETQVDTYQNEYRIPITGTGTIIGTQQTATMFSGTGGTFTGTPVINTTYYTSNDVIG